MHPLTNRLLAVLTGILACCASLAAQSLDGQVRELLQRADKAPLAQAWQIGRLVGELGDKEEPLAAAIRSQLAAVGDHGKLAAAVALQNLADGTQFGDVILAALQPVLTGKQPASQRAALHLARQDTFFSARAKRELRGLVKPLVDSDLTDPEVRTTAAGTLWRIGTTEEQRTAKSVLLDFVRSSNERLQVLGALTLADLNADPGSPAWPVLRRIADEPTDQGRLARSFLRIENQRREFDAMLNRFIQRRADPDAAGGTRPAQPDDLALIHEILERVAQRHARGDKVAREKMIEAAAKGLLRSLDRHSTYLSSDEYQRFYFDLNPEYGGIGAFVNFDQDEVFSIVRPIYSGPAYSAALRSGDKILEVDGWETTGHSSDEIISRLKGKPGTVVKIKVFRRGWDEPKEFSIVRRKIQVPSVNHELLPGGVGYVEVVTFGGRTNQELAAALDDLRKRGAKALVLDLRNNTGGYLEVATDIVGMFVPGRELVVYTQGRQAPRREYRTADRAILPELPLAVLINGYSASASEITAGALQDHGRAVIVGERSFGKGSVQSLLPLATDRPENYKDANENGQFDPWEEYEDRNKNGKYDIGPRLKLTIAHYFLPKGRCVHKQFDEDGKVLDPNWGVTPDKVLPLRDNHVRDRWKEAVLFDLIEKDVFNQYVGEHLEKHRKLFVELAEGDGGSADRYPEFETFYKGLDTRLSRDDIRRWVRFSARDKVADLRGKAFPGGRAVGDFQEDAQLQEAVRTVLARLDTDIRTLAAYKNVLKIPFGTEPAAKKQPAPR